MKSAKNPRCLSPKTSVVKNIDRALGARLADGWAGFGLRFSRISRREDKGVEDQAILTRLWTPYPSELFQALCQEPKGLSLSAS